MLIYARLFRLVSALAFLGMAAGSNSIVHAESMGGKGLHVYDGDTFSIGSERYRIAGIDAPEIGGRAKCQSERDLGEVARAALRRWMGRSYNLEPAKSRTGRVIHEKYGRTLVKVTLKDGSSATDRLISKGFAVPYAGRGSRMDWCKK